MPALVSLTSMVASRFRRQFTVPVQGGSYEATKAIDDFKGAGTYVLLAHRVHAFYLQTDRQVFYEPLSEFDDIRTLISYNEALCEGGGPDYAQNFLSISFEYFRSASIAPAGRLQLPTSSDPSQGLHCVGIIGRDDDSDSLVFVNSWGRGWGDDGVGYISREYFNRYVNDAWLYRRSRWGFHPAKWPGLERAVTPREISRLWMVDNPRWRRRFKHRGGHYEWIIHSTVSIDGSSTEIVELRTGYGLRIGWAHLHNLRGEQRAVSILKEFFVWPAFRRQGLGTLLEHAVVDIAQQLSSGVLQVWLHQADDGRGVLSPARKFFSERGYKWDWGTRKMPTLKAIGSKAL